MTSFTKVKKVYTIKKIKNLSALIRIIEKIQFCLVTENVYGTDWSLCGKLTGGVVSTADSNTC